MNTRKNSNNLQEIIIQVLDEMNRELGNQFTINTINLVEMSRHTGLSRGELRDSQKNQFIVKPHGSIGKTADTTVLSGFIGMLNSLFRKGIMNSSVCYDCIKEQGYNESKSCVNKYLRFHNDLVPPKRQLVSPQGIRGQCYFHTNPGESY